MAEKQSSRPLEKSAEIYRNVNLAFAAFTGAVAVAAERSVAYLSPELAPIAIAATAINLAQAGTAEVVRRWRKNRNAAPKVGKTALSHA